MPRELVGSCAGYELVSLPVKTIETMSKHSLLYRRSSWSFVLLLAGCAAFSGGLSAGDPVPYPEGYRDWTHVKTLALLPGHPFYETFGGIHHIYANAAALEGLKAGKGKYADGSAFAFDLLEAKSEDNQLAEGPRKLVGVMHKDKDAFEGTGGWGFAGYAGDGRENLVTDGGKSCFDCHAAQKEQGFVFTVWRP